jgi:hypothetical protein
LTPALPPLPRSARTEGETDAEAEGDETEGDDGDDGETTPRRPQMTRCGDETSVEGSVRGGSAPRSSRGGSLYSGSLYGDSLYEVQICPCLPELRG